ncbi:MAG: sensor domain-containing diguanylate cyclase, partial [Spirochaetota bacterium]|nr:sensor domain-containing diguanylate cyclase [Spirochaetota bacterium]
EIDRETGFTTNSIIGVPLKSRGTVFGVIELINKIDGTRFTALELSILQTIADYAAIAIEKAYYFKALKHIASIDSLTGLYNRRTFFRYLEKEIARVKRSKGTFALMMIDIDHFKQINDKLGHTAGDRVLLKLSALLTEITRSSDLVCRFGGDEFIVLLPNSEAADAKILKERVEAGLVRHNSESGVTPIQVSFGIHMADGENADSAVAFVDRDMYRDKGAKKGQPAEIHIEDIAEHTGNLINEEQL